MDPRPPQEAPPRMTILDHVVALRQTIIRMAVSVVACMSLAFLYRGSIASFIQQPLIAIDPSRAWDLQSLGVADSMTISLRLSFYAGLIAASPLLVYFLAAFLLPALTKKETRILALSSLVGIVLFLAGTIFGFFVVLPIALDFFFKDAQMMQWNPTWTVGEYYSFVTQFVLAFGLSFELPVLVMALVKFKITNSDQMRRTRRSALIAIFILSAVVTPTTDLVTLLLMAAPMILLYEVCIWTAHWMSKKAKGD